MTKLEKEKHETVARMMDRFRDLSKTSITTYTLMSELYRICYEDLILEVGMINLSTFNERLSEL